MEDSPGTGTSGPPLLVRPAQPGDAEDLVACWLDVGRYYAELAPQHFKVPAADVLIASFEESLRQPRSPDRIWLVAEIGGKVVGSITARLQPPGDNPGRQLVRSYGELRVTVDAVYVIGSQQRRGVGTRLMRAVEEWATTSGAVLVTLQTYAASPLSVPFYEIGLGYDRRAVVFEKRLA